MKAVLALEDGTIFTGEAFGAAGTTVGEVVFNTGMTGYQEVLTDPSHHGQIVVMTYPLIGNYGVHDENMESSEPRVKGFIIRELCDEPSNWRSMGTLEEFMIRYHIPGIQGIDTRALTRILAQKGTMKGVISTDPAFRIEDWADKIRSSPEDNRWEVSTQEVIHLEGSGHRAAIIDYGIKNSLLQSFRKQGWDIYVFPARSEAEELLSVDPDGIVLSNGPGNPKDCGFQIEVIRKLLGKKPVFGIGLGHQLTALAYGADTDKLKYGHRGVNHPVKDLASGITYITGQNHGYTVLADSLDNQKAAVSHINMNDGTVEGIRYKDTPTITVQFHPEASSCLMSTAYLFKEFNALMDKF